MYRDSFPCMLLVLMLIGLHFQGALSFGCFQRSCQQCATEKGCLYCGINSQNDGFCFTSGELQSCPGVAWDPSVVGCIEKTVTPTPVSTANQTTLPSLFTPSPQVVIDSAWNTGMYLVLVGGILLSALLLGIVLFFAWRRRSRLLQPLGYERLAFRAPQTAPETSSPTTRAADGGYVEVL